MINLVTRSIKHNVTVPREWEADEGKIRLS